MNTVDGTFAVAGEAVVRLEAVPRPFAARLVRRLGAARADEHDDVGVAVRSADVRGRVAGMTRIGRDDAAWSDDGRLAVRRAAGWLAIHEQAAGRVEVDVDPAVRDVSIVAGLVQLTLLARGLVPVHASAAGCDGRVVAAGGWSGGGKTAVLLGLVALGADPRAAEWIYLAPDGRVTFAGHAVRVRARHLGEHSDVASSLPPALRVPALAADRAGRVTDAVGRLLGPAGRPAHSLARRLERRAWVDVPLDRLGPSASSAAEPGAGDRLGAFVLAVRGGGAVDPRPLEPQDLVERLGAAFEEDVDAVDAAARRFAFAFGRPPTWAADWRDRYRRELADRLCGIPAWEVRSDDEALPDTLAAVLR